MSLSSFFRRRKDDPDASDVATSDAPVHPTKALARFLTTLSSRPQPVLLDLGPVVGHNVNFFGEHLGCKILVEDLAKDVDRHVRENIVDQLPTFFAKRFAQDTESIDGILCWDLFDYIERPVVSVVAQQLTRILRPEGALLAFFSTSEPGEAVKPTYIRHVVIDQTRLQHREYPASRGRQRPLLNRDIQRMFEPLRIAEQFLLQTNRREVLFRKRGSAADRSPEPAPIPSNTGA